MYDAEVHEDEDELAARLAQLVEALCYKTEGRGFESR
jgi:hypothetical protein